MEDTGIFKLNAEDIAFVSESSSQHNLGILYLESTIMDLKALKEVSSPKTKRRKLRTLKSCDECPSYEHWIKLAE